MAVRVIRRRGARGHGHIADSVVAATFAWAVFAQVRGHLEVQAVAVCKTVGSAYVGSNPTPATPWGNGPIAADSRLSGPFSSCPAVCHLVALWTAVSRCPRTYSGRRLGCQDGRRNRRLSTDSHGRAAPVACSGLT